MTFDKHTNEELATAEDQFDRLEVRGEDLSREEILSLYSGPLPPPRLLKEYDDVYPGLAKEIVTMVSAQSSHRQALEKAIVIGDGRRAWAGICCAFALALVSIVGGVYAIERGNKVSGTIIGTGAMAGLVSVFIYGTSIRKSKPRQD